MSSIEITKFPFKMSNKHDLFKYFMLNYVKRKRAETWSVFWRSLLNYVSYVPSSFCAFVPWFLRALITRLACLICYLCALLGDLIKGNYIYIYDVYILYIHIHITINYAINRIYEKTFRSNLSTQKNLSFDELLTTSYFLLLFVCTW